MNGGKTLKVLLINDTAEHLNWGAQATPFALRKMLAGSIPNVEITSLENEWLHRDYLSLQLLGARGAVYRRGSVPHLQWILDKISSPTDFFPEVADDFEVVAHEWLRGCGGPPAREFIEIASQADAVVYNAENSIYRNTKEGCRGIFLLWIAKTRLNRVAAIINQTAHITGVRPIMRAMIQLVYPTLDLVTAREPRSQRCLQELGIGAVDLVPDPVFAIEPKPASSTAFQSWWSRSELEGERYFCFSASGLPVSRPRGDWDGAVTGLVRRLQKLTPRAVLIAKDPHCQFLREVAHRTGSVFFGPENGFLDLWPLLRGSDFLVTGHYHYGIIAAEVGCPFVPLSVNNHKMHGLCEMLGMAGVEPLDVTFLNREADNVFAAASDLLKDREHLSRELLDAATRLKSAASANADRLRDILVSKFSTADHTDCETQQ